MLRFGLTSSRDESLIEVELLRDKGLVALDVGLRGVQDSGSCSGAERARPWPHKKILIDLNPKPETLSPEPLNPKP